MKNNRNIVSDWQKNWGTSIAVKVTAPVLWILVFVGLLVATILQNNRANDLDQTLVAQANRIAYQVSQSISDQGFYTTVNYPQYLDRFLKDSYFEYGTFSYRDKPITFGQKKTNLIKLNRPIAFTPNKNNIRYYSID